MINSECNEYVLTTKDLMDCQVKIKEARHSFLRKDSWVDCSNPCMEFTAIEIERQVRQKIGRRVGAIDDETRTAILENVKVSRILENRVKRWIQEGLQIKRSPGA